MNNKKSIFSYYTDAFKKYAQFNGRATRKQYWMFVLLWYLFAFVIETVAAVFLILAGSEIFSPSVSEILVLVYDAIFIVIVLFGLASVIPGLSISWRRMHDINKSGAWCFINLIPIVGSIWFLVLLCQPSDEGANQYGMPSV